MQAPREELIQMPLSTVCLRCLKLGPLLLALLPIALGAAEVAELPVPRHDLPGLKNFAQVSAVLFRGAQPTAEGFAELKTQGVKTVVNLRSLHSDRDKLTGTGLQYVEIPCHAWHPLEADVLEFLRIVQDPDNQPVFIHCQHGADRTGMMVAAYRMVEQGWQPEQAIEEVRRFGFHPVFGQIVKYLAQFDAVQTKRRLAESDAADGSRTK